MPNGFLFVQLSFYLPSVQASGQATMECLDMDYSISVVVVTFEVVFSDVAGRQPGHKIQIPISLLQPVLLRRQRTTTRASPKKTKRQTFWKKRTTQMMKNINRKKTTTTRSFHIPSPTVLRVVLEMRLKETQITTIPYQDRNALLRHPALPHRQTQNEELAEPGQHQTGSAPAPTTLDGDRAEHEGNEKPPATPSLNPQTRPKTSPPQPL